MFPFRLVARLWVVSMAARRGSARPPPQGWRPLAPVEERADTDNAALVSQVLDDPARGLALLHDRFARDVNRLVHRLLGPDGEHEDLVQQIFLNMIQSIGKLREPERLSFWVRSICVNVVRSELRKRAVRRAFLRTAPPPESGDLSLEVESVEFLTRSSKVLQAIPTEERVVLVLYYLEEQSLPEIAEICGFSSMTAKRRLSKARERFKRQMSRQPRLARLLDEKEVEL